MNKEVSLKDQLATIAVSKLRKLEYHHGPQEGSRTPTKGSRGDKRRTYRRLIHHPGSFQGFPLILFSRQAESKD